MDVECVWAHHCGSCIWEMGVDLAQGYFFGRPAPLDATAVAREQGPRPAAVGPVHGSLHGGPEAGVGG